MVRYEIIPATGEHAEELAPKMRAADVREVWSACRRRPLEALTSSLMVSRDPKAGCADGRVVCMFGVGTLSFFSPTGAPWLLGSDELPRHAKAFLRMSRDYVGEMRKEYPHLKNYVDVRNADAIRWLKWLGFDFLPAVPLGFDGLPFYPFEMVTPCATRQE